AWQGVISGEDRDQIESGLRQVWREIQAGTHEFRLADEDIHLSVEGRLREIIGAPAGRLHTGRSRNDQVATDFRMWCRESNLMLASGVVDTINALLSIGDRYRDAILPGYTHLQRAQPVLLRHHMLAYVEMLTRDLDRLRATFQRTNQCPLGAGALAGVTYPVDREYVAELLGFDDVCANSLDAVSDRDFVIDMLSTSAQISMHLSRLAEELVIWSTPEFGFIELDDAFATGSSIMPQKKNPDVAELIRGKAGRVYGHLMAMLTVNKGLPLAYNKDLQEDKEGLFDTVDTLGMILRVLPPMLESTTFRPEVMERAAGGGFALATDIADHLVKLGTPFREAHEIVGSIVGYCDQAGKDFSVLTDEEWRQFSAELADSPPPMTPQDAVEARNVLGGTGSESVAAARAAIDDRLAVYHSWIQTASALDAKLDQLLEDG
ncbi:MAG: argininosuccinate lyase, partial [Chloroflexota bacterium]